LIIATLALFILWQVISLAWAPAPYSGSRVASIWLGMAIFFTAGRFSLRGRSAEWLFYALSVISALLAGSVIFERVYYGGGMLGVFFKHGVSAEMLVTILPLSIISLLTSGKKWAAAMLPPPP